MSDITGPPAPKELQPSVRSADKSSQVAKDPNSADARTQDRQQSDSGSGESNANRTRDPAVSISATAAHVRVGEELSATIASADSEGRPIIITDKATFALKPDAGLQVEDNIVLKVTEADKAIIADLQARNGYALQPPVRIELIITEIHRPQNVPSPAEPAAKEVITNQPYRAPLSAQVKTETIIPVSSAIRPDASSAAARTDIKPHAPVNQAANNAVNPATTALSQINEKATLEQTSLATNAKGGVEKQVTAQSTVPVTNQPTIAANGPGIGTAINALSTTGQTAIIQVLDPSISKVSPTEIATVKQVSPLTAAHAVAIDTAGGKLLSAFDTAAALSVVETSRGTYIADSREVSQLTGELIRVATGEAQSSVASQINAAASAPTADAQTRFPALLIATEDSALPQRVSVSFTNTEPPSDTVARIQTATINNVTTQAAFLSPTGPKTDIRLQTTAGDVSLTIPSGSRPVAGDTLLVHWPEQAANASAPVSAASLPQAEIQAIDNATAQSAPIAASASILANWPAMQESVAAIAASGNTAATAAMQDKTAQGGGKLTNSLLFFLAAAGRAGPRAWIGNDAQQSLQNNVPSLLRQLSSDISQMANMASDRSGEWRAFMLPLEARTENVPLAALLVQQHPEINPDDGGGNTGSDKKDDEDNHRFILQVQFSVLGDIQLDGKINKRQFDLTVRSANTFNTGLQQDLKALFDVSLAANGYAGMLRFEEQHPFPINAEAIIEAKLTAAAQS